MHDIKHDLQFLHFNFLKYQQSWIQLLLLLSLVYKSAPEDSQIVCIAGRNNIGQGLSFKQVRLEGNPGAGLFAV
jgi:hypothetical protein